MKDRKTLLGVLIGAALVCVLGAAQEKKLLVDALYVGAFGPSDEIGSQTLIGKTGVGVITIRDNGEKGTALLTGFMAYVSNSTAQAGLSTYTDAAPHVFLKAKDRECLLAFDGERLTVTFMQGDEVLHTQTLVTIPASEVAE